MNAMVEFKDQSGITSEKSVRYICVRFGCLFGYFYVYYVLLMIGIVLEVGRMGLKA